MKASVTIRRLRLASGLVLFAYIATHYLNHMLGLVSLDAMDRGGDLFIALWRNPPATAALYGALLLHVGLAFWSIYQRRSLRMPPWEAAQLLLGLAIPPLLLIHILGTRIAGLMFGVQDVYAYVLLALWVADPLTGLQQAIVLLVAWTHGCIGLHFWLRIRPWYPRWSPYLYALALLWPVLALLGFAAAGREVARLAQDPSWMAAAAAEIHFPTPDQAALLYRMEHLGWALFAALLALTLIARMVRDWRIRHRALAVTYPGGLRVELQPGATLLEASRIGGVPHASVCGGRGRCSTCRVQVLEGMEALPPPSVEERRVLDRVSAGPGVRLACQVRPRGDVSIVPLLPPTATPRDAHDRPGHLQGHEEEIAILFADLRAFTRLAESQLPYDVVFLLNRYFRAMGSAVESAGGHLDKFIGDGVMALFGVGDPAGTGCRAALEAARLMALNLEEMNRVLAQDLAEPLRIGVGIHVGTAIVGEMGYGRATSVTAIGDAVNIASRLEELNKELRSQLVLSAEVALQAGIELPHAVRHEITVRGRQEPMIVLAIADARGIPALAAPSPAPRLGRRRRAPAEH
ncbi:MAG: adenylate/guanylate cyclase domain-containing protein [Dongiaceae bacterium]